MTTNSQAKEFKSTLFLFSPLKLLVLLIGDVRVGKTSFLTRFFLSYISFIFFRYTRNVVNKAEKPTVGVEFVTKNLVLKDGTIAKAKLWDTGEYLVFITF